MTTWNTFIKENKAKKEGFFFLLNLGPFNFLNYKLSAPKHLWHSILVQNFIF
jgi:hypothetical protein